MNTEEARYYSQTRPEMVPRIPPTAKKILDVGCGEGLFGKAIKEKTGAEVWGIELQHDAATKAETALDRVLIGDAVELMDTVPDGFFDCIVFNDILEHLIDPAALLVAAKKKLSPAGVVVCSIPNVRYFFTLKDLVLKKKWTYTDAGILDRTHLRFFTKNSIEALFAETGYAILSLEGINPITPAKFFFVNILTLGLFADTQYLEFACVAKPK